MSKRSRHRSLTGLEHEKFNSMTPKTKDFIQKICYKKTASVDMTQYGFITESRMGPINAYIKPLREQIQKIIDASKDTEDKTIIRNRRCVLSPDVSKDTEDKTIIRNRRCVLSPAPSPLQPSFSIDSSMKKFVKGKFQEKSVVFSL